MRIFSTFTGIGGFEIGIQRAALSVRHGATENTESATSKQGMEPTTESVRNDRHISDAEFRRNARQVLCVGYSEIDKYAIKVYEKQFKGVKNYGDITKINADELPDFDCLVGGFPCQAFSIAGKRKGFEDTRGTLFFDLARILRAKQPRLFVFENVKGLLSHDSGRTFKTIIQTIDELGYDCQWQVLNSKNFGVPQNRERVYIVGHLRGTPRPEVFPITGMDKEDYRGRATATGINNASRGYEARKEPIANALRAGQMGSKNIIYSKTIRSGGRSSPHGSKQNWDSYDVEGRIRRLTPKECERLQGFPDNWTAQGTDGAISDTQRYKMCGNAVTTKVVQAVFERILTNDQL